MIFKNIEYSPYQPSRTDVAWAKPVKGGFALYLYFNGKWQPQVVMNDEGTDTPEDDEPYDLKGIGAKKLADLEDVSLTSIENGQILKYNGSSWENKDDDTVTPGPDSVGTEQIIDGAVEMEDLHDDVKGKIQKTYYQENESLHMDYDVANENG